MAQNEITTVLKLNLEGDATSKFETAAASAKKFTSSTDRLIKNLELERIALEKGKDAMLLHKAAMEGATLDQLAHIKSTQAAIQAKKQEALASLEAANSEDYLSNEKQQAKNATDRLIQSLQIQEKEMREGKTAALVYRAALDGATKEQQELIAKLHQSVSAQNASNAAMGAGGRQARYMRGMFGQMGHQVQDVAVQMQMGTNAMLVFGQQGSQIASLLGPWGSIAGAAISIGAAMATFYSASGQAKQSATELEKTLESLSKTISVDLGKNTRQLTQDFVDLANSSSALAEVTIRQQYLQALKAGNLANEAFHSSTNELIGLTKQLGQVFMVNGSEIDAGAAATANLQAKFGLTADEATNLAQAIKSVSIDQANISELEDMLTQMAVGTKSSNQEFVDFAANVLESARKMKSAEEQAAFLKEVIGVGLPEAIKNFGGADVDGVVDDTAAAFERLRTSMLSKQEQLALEYAKNLQIIDANTVDNAELRNELMLQLQSQYNDDVRELENKQEEERRKLARQRLNAITAENDRLMAPIIARHNEELKAEAEHQKKLQDLQKGIQSIAVGGMSEIQRVQYETQQKLNIIAEAQSTELAQLYDFEAMKRGIIQESENEIMMIRSQAIEKQLNDQLRLIGGFEGMKSIGVDAISAIIKEGASMSDVFKMVGRSIVDNVIDTIVDMGVEYVKQALVRQAIEKTGATAAVATAMTTGTAMALAYAPAATMASLASFGANAAPAQAGMASTAGLAKALASFEGGGFTGIGPRSGGVDGKGGFPAILHPNETVVDHTKGQGMGGVTIVNNIDASGAGPEVDQKIVAAMEITSQQTVKQVQDLLRRQRLV